MHSAWAANIWAPFFLSFQVHVSGDKYTLHSQPLDLSKHNLTCVAISLAPYQIMRPDRDKRFYNPCCLCFCLHSPAETANNYHQRQREIYTLSVEVPVCMLSSSLRKKSKEETALVQPVQPRQGLFSPLGARAAGGERGGCGRHSPIVDKSRPG